MVKTKNAPGGAQIIVRMDKIDCHFHHCPPIKETVATLLDLGQLGTSPLVAMEKVDARISHDGSTDAEAD